MLTRIQSGDIINFILGQEGAKTLMEIEKIVNDAKEPEDIHYNSTIIAEGLATYKTMQQHIYRNKWREGIKGGAIAGLLIAGISPAVSSNVTLEFAALRMFSGVVAGSVSSLVYRDLNQYCNKEKKREAQIGVLLDVANNKKAGLENTLKHTK